jgi:hypothetical protein
MGDGGVRLRWIIGLIGGSTLAGFVTVVILHSQDYCISQGRYFSDKEMYAVALKNSSSPYRIEALERIELAGPGTLLATEALLSRASTLPSRVDQLMKSPDYVKACCNRTRAWEGGDYPPPTFLKVFFGMSPRGVELTNTTIEVAPESIFPPLHQINPAGGNWFTDVDKGVYIPT